MVNADVISMPDKWEYPWYAAWDLAFHTVALALVDSTSPRQQLLLMLEQRYLHPSGQMPAYEWNFGDVNPPVHAWAAWILYQSRAGAYRPGRHPVPRSRSSSSSLMNFTWWVNRKDPRGHNVFEGGFLGLDNIGVFDRSAPLPTGGRLEQADGTAWMAFYLPDHAAARARARAATIPCTRTSRAKFYEHFLWIAAAMDPSASRTSICGTRRTASSTTSSGFRTGNAVRLKVRSMVGLLSLCASTVFPPTVEDRLPVFMARVRDFTRRHPTLVRRHRAAGPARVRRSAPPRRSSATTSSGACCATCSTRTSS